MSYEEEDTYLYCIRILTLGELLVARQLEEAAVNSEE